MQMPGTPIPLVLARTGNHEHEAGTKMLAIIKRMDIEVN
jgi:hypothetical protein